MRYSTRTRFPGFASVGPLPPGVKWLLIANVAVYLVYFFAALSETAIANIFANMQLVPAQFWHGYLWQPVTYMFLHAVQSPMHLVFNMLMLWMFGSPLEQTWGTEKFLKYYFLCGIAAGLCVVVVNSLLGPPYNHYATIGASGALFGLLLAFGVLFADTIVMFSFLFPIKAKYMVMIMGALEFLFVCMGVNNGVSNVAHLGGMAFGYAYLKAPQFAGQRSGSGGYYGASRGRKTSLLASWREWYKEYKLKRARRKFQVYMRKHENDRNRFVN